MSVLRLPVFDGEGSLNTIIETPRGARSKYSFDEASGLFRLKKMLPPGTAFPFDFGFIPSTLGEDGGPLDVLVLTEEPSYPGVLVPARLLGAIIARQTKDGKIVRNDRFLAAAQSAPSFARYRSWRDVEASLLERLEQFFIFYNHAEGKKFMPQRRAGAPEAKRLLRDGEKAFRAKHGPRPGQGTA